MNASFIPPSDSAGVFALMALLADKDACAQRLNDLTSAQQKIYDLIKQSETQQAELSDLAAKAVDAQAKIDADTRALMEGQADLAARKTALAEQTAAHDEYFQDGSDALAERERTVLAREVAAEARETAIANKEAQTQAALDAAQKLKADLENRISLIQKAQA